MRESSWHRANRWGRNTTPFVLTTLLLLISLVPLRIPELARIPPMLTLIAVYHWTVFRPNLLPAAGVFVLGLLQDFLSGGPLGLHTLILMLAYGAVLSQRRFFVNKSFAVVWIGFMALGLGVQMLAWVVGSALLSAILPVTPFAHQYLLSVAVFPFIVWLLVSWERFALESA